MSTANSSVEPTTVEADGAAADSMAQSTPDKDPLRHHQHYEREGKNGKDPSPYAGGSSFMERVAEGTASGMGTVQFVLIGSIIILTWVFINGAVAYFTHTFHAIEHGGQFDPEPWILLNLIFSGVAFYTGALVIIAQKAQTRTDKANEEASARHRDELSQYQNDMLQKNTDLTQQVHDISQKMHRLSEEIHAATCKGATISLSVSGDDAPSAGAPAVEGSPSDAVDESK